MIAENEQLLLQDEDTNDLLDIPFTKTELICTLRKIKESAPGRDQICYTMINHLSKSSKDTLLELYKKLRENEKLPKSCKEATISIIVTVRKTGKNYQEVIDQVPYHLIFVKQWKKI